MASVKVKLRVSTVPQKEGRLIIQVIQQRETKTISTSLRLFPEEWDKEKEQIIPTASTVGRINYLLHVGKEIQDTKNIIEKIAWGMVDDLSCSAEKIVEQYHRKKNPPRLSIFMEEKIKELQQKGKNNTAEKYRTTLRLFTIYKKKMDIFLEALDTQELKNFETYLIDRGVSMNTVSFYMRILRAVYNKAVKAGQVKRREHLFEDVYTGIAKTAKRAISENTIRQLQELKLNKHLSYTRDLFLFSFYTRGMSFVDMAYLKKDALSEGVIHYRRSKTGQSLSIKTEPCIREIIERYTPLTQGNEYILPIIRRKKEECNYFSALRTYNLRLKNISRMLNLEHPLTSYVARHSWASIARHKGVPLPVISEGMGHSSEKTTRIYLDSLDQSVLDKANQLIICGIYKTSKGKK